MLKMSLDALVNLDVDTAYKVITLDDEGRPCELERRET